MLQERLSDCEGLQKDLSTNLERDADERRKTQIFLFKSGEAAFSPALAGGARVSVPKGFLKRVAHWVKDS
jgi:hypothetical protein